MFLQLHGHEQLASQNFPSVPDLILPEAFKISKREILNAAINDAVDIVTEEVNKAIQNRNQKSIQESLPSLDTKGLEEIQLVLEEEEGLSQNRQMAGPLAFLFKAGKFLLKYGKVIYDFSMRAIRTVKLLRVNRRIQEYYDTNQFNFRNLNELNKQQIDKQINLLAGEYVNAQADKDEVKAMAVGRLISGYNQRKISLPSISQRTLLLAGGVLAAYLLIRK
jgi:uncharacterized SAM-dependent methyltransferase